MWTRPTNTMHRSSPLSQHSHRTGWIIAATLLLTHFSICCSVTAVSVSVSSILSPPSSSSVDSSCVVPSDDISVSLMSIPTSPPPGIQNDFISFSLEVDIALEWTGRYPAAPRPAFTRMMSMLGNPTLRIGGDSTDYSWYNPNNHFPPYRTRPFRYNITDVDILSLQAGVRSYGGQLVFGVNFRQPLNATFAVSHLLAIDRIIGLNDTSVLGIEIGNEVDLYPGNGDRPGNWTPAEYYLDWEYYVSAITSAIPHTRGMRLFQAATYAGSRTWLDDLDRFMARDHDRMVTLAIHHYPDDTSPRTTLALQLSDEIASAGARLLVNGTRAGNIIEIANSYGIDTVIGEGNTNVEPGQLGVCDVFAGSALWAIDEMFHVVQIGLRRFHWHSHEMDLRTPVYFYTGSPIVRPLWYGLMFFARIKENIVRMITVNTVCSNNPLVKVYTVQDHDGNIKIAILHKDLNATKTTILSIDTSLIYSQKIPLYVIRLIGTPLQKENITLAGQTWTGSQDGRPLGMFVQETVMVDADGLYRVKVEPITAVMISNQPFKPM